LKLKMLISETVLTHNEIDLWLNQLNNFSFRPVYLKCEKILRYYEISSYPCLYRTDLTKLKTGIGCPRCHQFTMKEEEDCMYCSCDHVEVKTKSYLRTICDYEMLFPDRVLC